MSKSIIGEKSYSFSLKIIKLYSYLVSEKKMYSLADQILRSGTSIGANVEEALGGLSDKDFRSKLMISYKEARETKYWLRLLEDSNLLDKKYSHDLMNDCEELLKIIYKITYSMKMKINNSNKY